MQGIQFSVTTNPDFGRLDALLDQDAKALHNHAVDMPYRLTSSWQDHGGEIGLWENDGQLLAWAVFQPPWWNVDYAIHPAIRGSLLESDIFTWGKGQMKRFANRTGEDFWGSFEFFADTPQAERTMRQLVSLGFQKFDWSILRFTRNLRQAVQLPQPMDGFHVRPLRGESEVDRYVELHRAAFNSEIMTTDWRRRMLRHSAYRPELDLVVVDSADVPVGFCVCWARQDVGQIEPLGVLPEYQGRGLGRLLELTASQILRDHGLQTMVVDHASFNEAAIALSEQTGFTQSNNALRYYVEISPD